MEVGSQTPRGGYAWCGEGAAREKPGLGEASSNGGGAEGVAGLMEVGSQTPRGGYAWRGEGATREKPGLGEASSNGGRSGIKRGCFMRPRSCSVSNSPILIPGAGPRRLDRIRNGSNPRTASPRHWRSILREPGCVECIATFRKNPSRSGALDRSTKVAKSECEGRLALRFHGRTILSISRSQWIASGIWARMAP